MNSRRFLETSFAGALMLAMLIAETATGVIG